MQRRQFLRVVIPASVLPRLLLAQQSTPAPPPPAPVPWTLGLSPATPLPHTVVADEVAATELRFFSSAQMGSLVRLSDLLMPPLDGRPGAVQAEAPAFLDFLIGDSPDTRKQLYTGGLDWLDAEAKRRFQRSFSALTDEQAGSIIQPWLRTWLSDHPPQEAHADFINIAHADIRTATVNSKPWSDASTPKEQQTTEVALYWQPIQPDLSRSTPWRTQAAPTVIAAPKAEHTSPSYPH